MNWRNIRVYNNSQNNAFKELVCQLARQEKSNGYKKFIRNGTLDGGVECFGSLKMVKSMVKLQLAANAIAKSRSQIKPKPVKDLSINTFLIFSMADALGCSSHISGSKQGQSIIKNPRLNELVTGRCIFIAHSWHVETVCLLSKLNVEHHIEVEINLDEMDLTKAESKTTYEEIKEYVLEHTGMKVSNLYIAQVKRKCGIMERVNYNLPRTEDSRQPNCPLEKEVAIREVLEYFQMI